MRVLYVPVGYMPTVKEISGSLESMQDLVHGWIECLHIADDVALVCNEEGKINGSKANRFAFDDKGNVIDIIYGDFFIVGAPPDKDDFASLTDEQIAKYELEYRQVAESWLYVG